MALRTQPTALEDTMAGWWPSRYGADDHVLHQDIPAFPGRTYNGFRLADIVEDHGTNRLGAAGRHGARPEPVTAHA